MAKGDSISDELSAAATADDAQETRQKIENIKKLPGSPPAEDGERVDKDDVQTDEDPPSSEYDPFAEYDDESSDHGPNGEPDEYEISQESMRPRDKYELIYWPYHL